MSDHLAIPDDLAQRTARLVDEIEDQLAAAQADKKQVYADLRDELKSLGMAGPNISKHVAAFKAAISELRMTADAKAKSVERDDQASRYVEIIKAASRARAPARTREAVPEHDADGVIIEPNSAPDDAPAGSMADSDGGVDATTVAPIQPETATDPVAKADDEAEAGAIGAFHDAQADVATTAEVESVSRVGSGRTLPATSEGMDATAGETAPVHEATGKPAEPSPAAPLYAAPGIVVMEKCPPLGIVAHPYAACWPVKPIDVSGGVREPIVKIEHFILDGRGRYFAARDAGIEYPVVQYDGIDPLMDSIRWNLASRPARGEWLAIVAHKLCKLAPDRADEIMSAMGLAEEREAAE